ncbi:MAG TPA: hypothetical protein VHO25_24085 [Polyangiaceae bacterium]|nr:hypothetical protein [Polyangiaceae bacterium]
MKRHPFHKPTYDSWRDMKRRCYDRTREDFKRYGALGVRVTPRWLKSYTNFLADVGERPAGMQLDRINGSKLYSKDTCKWSTRAENTRNRRCTQRVIYGGKLTAVAEVAEREGVDYELLRGRLRCGWDLDEALSVPRGGERWAANRQRKAA